MLLCCMLLEDIYSIIYSYLQFIYSNLKPIEQQTDYTTNTYVLSLPFTWN